MKSNIKKYFPDVKSVFKLLSLIFYNNVSLKRRVMQDEFQEKYIQSFYPTESLREKKFYNIGAGNQRSKYDFWSYMDLPTSKYKKDGIDIFFDLESLAPIPLPDDDAEVVFTSFVIEHISVQATRNLCREAFRILKKGGVFHSKIHCYDYAFRLWKHNIISPKIPFENRESKKLLENFIRKHSGKVKASFNSTGEYIVESTANPGEAIVFNASNSFIYHNATASLGNLQMESPDMQKTLSCLGSIGPDDLYKNLQYYSDLELREPHQHNADYFAKEDLIQFIKEIGFSEVYFTQPFQSVSPALWEDKLNPTHSGFLFSIEAIK